MPRTPNLNDQNNWPSLPVSQPPRQTQQPQQQPQQLQQPVATKYANEAGISPELDELIKEFVRDKLATKPIRGPELGDRVKIFTNCFNIEYSPFVVTQHKITMKWRMNPANRDFGANPWRELRDDLRELMPVVIEKCGLDLGAYYYLDKRDLLWSNRAIEGELGFNAVFNHRHKEEEKEFDFNITKVGRNQIDVPKTGLTPECLQILNTALNHLTPGNFVFKGSKIYAPDKGEEIHEFKIFDRKSYQTYTTREIIGPNLLFIPGLFKSVRISSSNRPMIMADWSATLVEKEGPMEQVFARILYFHFKTCRLEPGEERPEQDRINSSLSPRYRKTILGELKGFTARQTIGVVGRRFKITDITENTAYEQTFMLDGREISVAQYFKETYQVTLQNENMPCFILKNVQPANTGQDSQAARSNTGDSYLPCEICELVPNQVYDKNLPGITQANVTKLTIINPYIRLKKTKDLVEGPLASMVNKLPGKSFMDINPITTVARVLPPPTIGQIVPKLSPNVTKYSLEFNSTTPLKHWVGILIKFSDEMRKGRFNIDRTHPVSELTEILRDCANNNSKWTIWQCHAIYGYNFDRKDVSAQQLLEFANGFVEFLKKQGTPQLIFWVFPKGHNDLYRSIKYICNQHAVASQCLNFDGSQRGLEKVTSGTFIKNLLLKMNVKVGGTNAALINHRVFDILKSEKVMVVGMDVYHPGVGDKDKPSIAGFVGSYDKHFLKYTPIAKVQPRTGFEEVIDQVKPAMDDFLTIYYQKNGKNYPEAVIFFRDGVSEGQFEKVAFLESKQIFEAFKDHGLGNKIKLTHLTVQKRHKFRMYRFQEDGKGHMQCCNPLPGTVIDQDVVHPKRFEYYLNSHYPILGTSKPSHQTVIVNDSKITYNGMEMIAYYLSWISARCTKPISVPVPAQYAHLVAERANLHFEAARGSTRYSRLIAGILGEIQRAKQRNSSKPAFSPNDRAVLDQIIMMNPEITMSFA